MEESSKEHFFSVERATPVVARTDEIFSDLGFQKASPEVTQEEMSMLNDFFKRSVRLKYDEEENIVTDETREQLPIPPTSVIEKEGKQYFQFQITERMSIITTNKPIRVQSGSDEFIDGLTVEHMLLAGEIGNSLDLMSLRIRNKARNIYSFSGVGNFQKYPRSYIQTSDGQSEIPRNLTNGQYGHDVILSLPVKRDEDGNNPKWDYTTDPLDIVFLHENAHAADNTGWAGALDKDKHPGERRANAIVLETVRRINQEFQDDHFITNAEARIAVRNQLFEGYGGLRKDESTHSDEDADDIPLDDGDPQ